MKNSHSPDTQQQSRESRQRKRPSIWRWLWRLIASLFVVGIFATAAAAAWVILVLVPTLPDTEELRDITLEVPMRVYTADGKLIGEYGTKRRIPVTYDELPPILVDAFTSIEDARFFKHYGVDPIGIGRAVYGVLTGERRGGGSTITMQVARNYYLSREQTYSRKLNEILLALKIERELNKQEILELYVNKIFLGQRAHGVAAAAQIYYGKALLELTLSESAMIAGLPQAPSRNNPISNPSAAAERRNRVLARMLANNKIGQTDYQAAVEAPMTARIHATSIEFDAHYVAEMTRKWAVDRFGKGIINSGVHIYTTIDSKIQEQANRAVRFGLLAYDRRHGYTGPADKVDEAVLSDPLELEAYLAKVLQPGNLLPAVVTEVGRSSATLQFAGGEADNIDFAGVKWAGKRTRRNQRGRSPRKISDVLAVGHLIYVYKRDDGYRLAQLPTAEAALVTMDPGTGQILALSGGFDFQYSKFNRATQAVRQVGSTFKPFLYAAALETGDTPATVYNDAPVVYRDASLEGDWKPANYSGRFYGPTRLREALVRSLNLVSIRILEQVGIDAAVEYLARFGFDERITPKSMSMALGSGAATPLAVTRGFATFANNGRLVTPEFIARVETSDGEIMFEPELMLACDGRCPEGVKGKQAEQVIDARVAFLIRDILRDVMKRGTAASAKSMKRPDFGGKTGTTNDQVDAWFAGFNRDLVTTVWVGRNDNKSLGKKETGGVAALSIWKDYMSKVLADRPVLKDPPPNGVVQARVNKFSGARVSSGGAREYFLAENIASRTSTVSTPVVNSTSDSGGGGSSSTAEPNTLEDLF